MSETEAFLLPEIDDVDVTWAAELLGLRPDAFGGPAGDDRRAVVMKSVSTLDVSACPGSGKTTLLVGKLAALGRQWPSTTQGICVVSHTNAARYEIEERLADCPIGQELLARPHFVGTIHGFINEFLAIPWMRSLGYPVKLIDSEICGRIRWRRLQYNSRYFLETNKHLKPGSIHFADADFTPCLAGGAAFPCGPDTATYKDVHQVLRSVAGDGYHCYEDAFTWANDLIDRHSVVVEMMRDRFPLLFVDEAQDNSEMQSALLHRLFTEGPNPVVRQRLGDPNQAIYDFDDAGAATDPFPDESIRIDLPNSHRFGQRIADLADPLGITPYGLVGLGAPRTCEGVDGSRNYIILFDPGLVGQVLPTYGRLLLDTFQEEDLADGSFIAVGQIHQKKDDAAAEKIPRCVGDYWSVYDAGVSARSASPKKFLQYLFAGQQRSAETGEAHHAVEGIAKACLRLMTLMASDSAVPRRSSSHQTVLGILSAKPGERDAYLNLVETYCLALSEVSPAAWDGGVRSRVEALGRELSGKQDLTEDAVEFLAWTDTQPADPAAGVRLANVYEYPSDTPKVAIRVGSIHSVKGETHTATLVLESYWFAHNLEKLAPWLLGDKQGLNAEGDRQAKRLRTHYVAMTRPTHMLCLAMRRSSWVTGKPEVDAATAATLEARGWTVVTLVESEGPEFSIDPAAPA